MKPIPLSLYIHIPWCIKKCPYCDFNSYPIQNDIQEDDYIEALIKDLEYDLLAVDPREIQSLFIGGGTPSLFSAESYARLFAALRDRITIVENAEITLEANPGTVEQQRFKAYREIGINRLSIGVQSFQNDKLKRLGRIHNSTEAKKAIETAKAAGFNNINIDLMFGLPNQTIDDLLFDLSTAISFSPTHISWYQLTLEPNTLFFKKSPQLPEDDAIYEMQLKGQTLLDQHGYQQYEVSAYSLPEHQCQHNRNYWEFGDYLGIGAGAHGKITDPETHLIRRTAKQTKPKSYLEAYRGCTSQSCNTGNPFVLESTIVKPEDIPGEFMLNALRLQQPIPFELFQQRTGLEIDVIKQKLELAQQRSLLTINQDSFELTPLGHRFLNDVIAIFL